MRRDFASALSRRVVAGAASRAVCRRGDRRPRPSGDGSGAYPGSGSASYHPTMLLGLLVYGYATGVFSSRKLERATYDSVAFRFIAANDHPDHDTDRGVPAAVSDRDRGAVRSGLPLLAREMGVLKMGTVALDGTKIHANASRHSALSYRARRQDRSAAEGRSGCTAGQSRGGGRRGRSRAGCRFPKNWRGARSACGKSLRRAREDRGRAPEERYERELAEHEAKLAARAAKTAATRQEARRQKPPEYRRLREPLPKDRINLTDEGSRIMPVAGGGFDQCYNAQAAVAAGNTYAGGAHGGRWFRRPTTSSRSCRRWTRA